MVAWIIGGHALLGYAAIGGLPALPRGQRGHAYSSIRTGAISTARPLGTVRPIGTFFFLAGLFSQPAVARKGPARFAADRTVRLGLPFLAFVALIWPLFMWFADPGGGLPRVVLVVVHASAAVPSFLALCGSPKYCCTSRSAMPPGSGLCCGSVGGPMRTRRRCAVHTWWRWQPPWRSPRSGSGCGSPPAAARSWTCTYGSGPSALPCSASASRPPGVVGRSRSQSGCIAPVGPLSF